MADTSATIDPMKVSSTGVMGALPSCLAPAARADLAARRDPVVVERCRS
jgi:hypothetical protein